MNLQTKLLVPVTAGLLGTGLLMVGVLWFAQDRQTRQQMTTVREVMVEQMDHALRDQAHGFDAIVDQFSVMALRQAGLLSDRPEILAAYRTAHEGDIDDPFDPRAQAAREALRETLAPTVEAYRRHTGLSRLKVHYHLPNARSLVRLWRTGGNAMIEGRNVDASDDISAFRQSVIEVNRPGRGSLRGIEIGRGGFAIRGLAPVTDTDGTHLGSVEILYPFSDAVARIADTAEGGLAVYMHARFLDVATRLQNPDDFPVLDDTFVQCAITEAETLSPLISPELLEAGLQEHVTHQAAGHAVAAWPIRDFSGRAVGVMVLGRDTSAQLASLAAIEQQTISDSHALLVRIAVGTFVAGGLLMGMFTLMFRHVVRRPLDRIVDRLRDIAEGDGDLTQRVNADRSDELGRLGHWFNQFMDNLHAIIVDVAAASRELAGAGTQISASSEELSRGMQQQTRQIEQISSAVGEMSQSAQDISRQTLDMSGTARDTGDVAGQGGEVVGETIRSMHAIDEAVQASASSIRELSRRGEQIGTVIELINDIADQTNLLALNAAIEAARAGEHGRGFAVVADEVRKLADRTTSATDEIGESIRAIQTETGETVRRMEAGAEEVSGGVAKARSAGESLNQIVGQTHTVADLVQSVAAAAEQQAAACTEVSTSVESISAVAREADQATGAIAASATDLSRKAEMLKGLVERFRLSTDAPR